jgi:hypothetical protein
LLETLAKTKVSSATTSDIALRDFFVHYQVFQDDGLVFFDIRARKSHFFPVPSHYNVLVNGGKVYSFMNSTDENQGLEVFDFKTKAKINKISPHPATTISELYFDSNSDVYIEAYFENEDNSRIYCYKEGKINFIRKIYSEEENFLWFFLQV